MNDMLVDIDFRGKIVLIIGGGRVGERKATKFLGAGARVVVASKGFTRRLKRLGFENRLRLITVDLLTAPEKLASLTSNVDFVIAATNQPELNKRIAERTKRKGRHVDVVDNPQLGDFTMPVISRIGEFDIAISTDGKSPAMSRLIRKRIEGMIAKEDVLMVRLQAYARKLAKVHIASPASRRRLLLKIIQDSEIRHLLKNEDLQQAKHRAKQIINS